MSQSFSQPIPFNTVLRTPSGDAPSRRLRLPWRRSAVGMVVVPQGHLSLAHETWVAAAVHDGTSWTIETTRIPRDARIAPVVGRVDSTRRSREVARRAYEQSRSGAETARGIESPARSRRSAAPGMGRGERRRLERWLDGWCTYLEALAPITPPEAQALRAA